MSHKLSTYANIIVVGSTVMFPARAGQQPDTRSTRADLVEVRTLLNRPGGLEILAKRRKHFLIDNQPELWSDLSLNTLMEASSEIAFVTIQSRSSRLISNGDDIVTDYVFQPIEVFKGTFSKNEMFSAPGGKVTFSNGTSAEISTIEWRNLKVGSQYILFLKESDEPLCLGQWSRSSISDFA